MDLLGVWDWRTWIWKELSLGNFEKQPHRFPSLHLSQTMGEKKNRRMTNVRENMNLPKGVQEKKTARSSTVLKSLLGLLFKSRINFVTGKKLRHVGLLRNSTEETIGMVGDRVEERWRLANSKFSHLFSLCLAQESGLVPGSSPLSLLYTGKAWLPPLVALALLWIKNWASEKPSWMKKVHSVTRGFWQRRPNQQNLSSANTQIGKSLKSLHL